jgi:hypothetical protein
MSFRGGAGASLFGAGSGTSTVTGVGSEWQVCELAHLCSRVRIGGDLRFCHELPSLSRRRLNYSEPPPIVVYVELLRLVRRSVPVMVAARLPC